MRISIFGLGYVGAVSAACLSSEGHTVIGVDPVQMKVDLVNRGKTPIIERDVDNMIERAVKAGKLRATTSATEAVGQTDLSFICVGTPSQPNGGLELRYVRRVCEKIGSALKHKLQRHVVVVRSTVLPGTIRNVVIPTLEEYSHKRSSFDFGVCSNPEFLREGSSVYDFYHPPKTVVGATDMRSADLVASLYEKMDAPLVRTDLETAELVKYTDNAWHALKIAFANEIGVMCKAIGIDSHKVMDIFCRDTKLNISPAYMKPGFAFGGSCLPKDLRALIHKALRLDLDLPVLKAILPSNMLHVERGIRMIMEKGNKRVGVLGFSFKEDTDDLRESPMVEVIERLIGKGYDIRLYDRNVNLASLVGANRDYILNHIPHISKLMVPSIDELLAHARTLVIGNGDKEFRGIVSRLREEQVVVDLVRITEAQSKNSYDGICW